MHVVIELSWRWCRSSRSASRGLIVVRRRLMLLVLRRERLLLVLRWDWRKMLLVQSMWLLVQVMRAAGNVNVILGGIAVMGWWLQLCVGLWWIAIVKGRLLVRAHLVLTLNPAVVRGSHRHLCLWSTDWNRGRCVAIGWRRRRIGRRRSCRYGRGRCRMSDKIHFTLTVWRPEINSKDEEGGIYITVGTAAGGVGGEESISPRKFPKWWIWPFPVTLPTWYQFPYRWRRPSPPVARTVVVWWVFCPAKNPLISATTSFFPYLSSQCIIFFFFPN